MYLILQVIIHRSRITSLTNSGWMYLILQVIIHPI